MAGESSKSKGPVLDIDGHNLPPSPAPSTPRSAGRKYALATELVYTESSDQYNASSVPIYQVCQGDYKLHARVRTNKSNMRSLLRSSKSRRPAAVASTTTHAPVTPHEHILKGILPRS